MPKNLSQNLKFIAVLQFFVALFLVAGAWWYGGVQLGASTAAGALIMLLNSAGIAWAWWRILSKKPVAWTIGIIVVKYAVLLSAILHLSRASWFSPLGAGIGIMSFLVAVLGFAVTLREKETE
jgi:hypothetical protein